MQRCEQVLLTALMHHLRDVFLWLAAQGASLTSADSAGAVDLSSAIAELKRFNAKRKLKVHMRAAQAVLAFQRLGKLSLGERLVAAARAADDVPSTPTGPLLFAAPIAVVVAVVTVGMMVQKRTQLRQRAAQKVALLDSAIQSCGEKSRANSLQAPVCMRVSLHLSSPPCCVRVSVFSYHGQL